MSTFRIKQEPIDIAAMDDEEEAKGAAAAATGVKREPGAHGGPSVKLEPGGGGGAGRPGAATAAAATAAMRAAASVGPPPPPPPKQRPSFTLSAPSSSGAAAASSSSAAGASSAAAPAVLNSSSLRARLQRRPRSILDYLCSLDRGVLDALYRDPFTCLTIFRSLHPLAKQYLLRWLFVSHPLRLSLVDSWVLATPTSRTAHKQAMDTLFELQLLLKDKQMTDNAGAAAAPASASSSSGATVKTEPGAAKGEVDPDPLVWFNPPFQKCLQDALCNKVDATGGVTSADGSESAAAAAAAAADPDRPSLGELEAYAADKWDAILHFMVGAARVGASTGPPSREVVARLVSMGLMEAPGGGGAGAGSAAAAASSKPHITPSGFAFLFKDMATQVWDVILAYMESLSPAAHADRDQVLQFLFRLSFLKLGAGYPTAGLSDTQRKLLADLTAFGLVYMKRPSAHMYYPTRLALNLSSTSGSAAQGTAAAAAAASSASAVGVGSSSIESSRSGSSGTASSSSASSSSEGYIILETTFRLYAFTTSPFHSALLGLFTRLDIRLPNLLVGTITKESVRSALKAHISSAEIIAYLEAYARADMRVNTPVLPENVTDQIRLWEAERNRMALQESFLFEFDSNDTAQVVALVTQEAFRHPHTLLLHHPAKRLLVVTPDGYAILKAFKLRLNQQMAAGINVAKQV